MSKTLFYRQMKDVDKSGLCAGGNSVRRETMQYIGSGDEMQRIDAYSIETMGIPGIVLMERAALAMEEEIASNSEMDPSTVNAVKSALMGPLAGIGDSLFQGTFRLIAAGVAAELGLQGNIMAPFVFLILYNVPHFAARWWLMWKSYALGSKFIQMIYKSNVMEKLTLCFGIMGLMVIGSMTCSMVNVSTPLVIQFGEMEPMALQSLFDQILPGLLPLATTWVTSILLKKQVSMLKIMAGMFVIGIAGVLIGIL